MNLARRRHTPKAPRFFFALPHLAPLPLVALLALSGVADAGNEATPDRKPPPAPAAPTAGVRWARPSLREVYNPSGEFYAYAPSAITIGATEIGATEIGATEHLWLCHNAAGVIKDSIFYVRRVAGKVVTSKPVLHAGAPGAWDSFHVCDPAVVAGRFRLDGADYRYAMFYLGNDVDASRHNQIGVAFANDIGGPWMKYPQPVVRHPNDGHWGVGQPSATSVDGKGRLLLFYTRGAADGTRGWRRAVDLGDMSQPRIGPAVPLTNAGLTDANGKPGF